MKITHIIYSVLFAAIMVTTGCKSENKELKAEAKTISEVMCRTIGIMHELKNADPADTAKVAKLQIDYQNVQKEITTLYESFRKKHEGKDTSEAFTAEFRKFLNESMLECKNLSKEERETFAREVK